MHLASCLWRYVYMTYRSVVAKSVYDVHAARHMPPTKNSTSTNYEPWGIVQIFTIHVQVLVIAHIDWKALGGEAQSECDAIIICLHLALFIEGFTENSFTFVIVCSALRTQGTKSVSTWHAPCICTYI
jgi:hypothetical protein